MANFYTTIIPGFEPFVKGLTNRFIRVITDLRK